MRLKKILFWQLSLSLLFVSLFAGYSRAEVVVQEKKNAKGNTEILVENQEMKFVISPSNGGMVTSFIYKKTGNEWVFNTPSFQNQMGLFADHLAQQTWPGECMFSKYDYEIIKAGPDEAAVKLWYTIKDNKEDISGLKIEKTISVTDKSPCLVTRVRFVNATDKSKAPRYWFQNAYIGLGKTMENNYCYRPSTRGVRIGTWYYSGLTQKREGEEFVKDPAQGWLGNLHPKSAEGVVFLLDYNYLDWFYNCITGNTIEWFYDQVNISPGKYWETEVITRPTQGFDALNYASRNIIASATIKPEGKNLKVEQTICATDKELKEVKVLTEIYASANKEKVLGSKETSFAELGRTPVKTTVIFPGITVKNGIVVARVTVNGQGWQETYETYYDPSTLDKAFFGPTDYRIPADKKQKDFNLPEKEVVLNSKLTNVLELRGLYYEYYGLEKAVRIVNPDAKVRSSFYSGGQLGSTLSYFPGTIEDFYQYDLIVINNIPVEAISYDGKILLQHYLKQGGRVLVIGGYLSLGNGDYKDTVLEEILPVNIKGKYDLTKFKKWEKIEPGDKTIFTGINWKEKPSVLWYQDVLPKPGAKILLYGGAKKPFLTTWSYGKGKCGVMNGLALGKPDKNITGFWEWNTWPALMAEVLKDMGVDK